MKYADGQEIQLEDQVAIGPSWNGVVVCVIETGMFTTEYPAEDWAGLEKGMLVMTDKAGLIHYEELDEDVRLVKRAT